MPAKSKYTRKQSRSKNFVAIPVEGTLALGALAANALVSGNILGALTEDLFSISADLMINVSGLTSGEGQPLIAGFSHADYSDTEVEENLEVNFLGPGDKIAQERARRLVRKMGVLEATVDQTRLKLVGRYGSSMTRIKLKFVINSGKGLDLWIYNKSGAVLTTGGTARFMGTVYGKWMI